MICPSCKHAGKVLSIDPELAEYLHKNCRSVSLNDPSQCTCAHVTASVLAVAKRAG